MDSNEIASRSLRVLMLHGYGQSGVRFHAKTASIEKALEKAFKVQSLNTQPRIDGVELVYPTGPTKLSSTDEKNPEQVSRKDGNWGWWRMDDAHDQYSGLDAGLSHIADTIRQQGPFDGVIGFSQGAIAAAMVASLLETGRQEAFENTPDRMHYPPSFKDLDHPPMKFVVCYSGLAANGPHHASFYTPKIQTPGLHFIGSMDTVVEESSSRELMEHFEMQTPHTVVRHAGGHSVPNNKRDAGALIYFIRQTLMPENTAQGESISDDEDVTEMDLPF